MTEQPLERGLITEAEWLGNGRAHGASDRRGGAVRSIALGKLADDVRDAARVPDLGVTDEGQYRALLLGLEDSIAAASGSLAQGELSEVRGALVEALDQVIGAEWFERYRLGR